MKSKIELKSIGTIRVQEDQGQYQLQLDPEYQAGLQGLESCTHAIIFWWADRMDNPGGRLGDLVVDLPYAPGIRSGVFANRSEARPNPIGVTTCYLLNVNQESGKVDLAWIDALDQTPLLDIKPYLPMSDRVMSAEYPDWLEGYPESMEDAAEFFSDPDNAVLFS
jgi:tRNA (adenine37-N6)-methyltransferase